MTRRNRFDRRLFLQSAGATAALLPLLSAELSSAEEAPLRLVILTKTNGALLGQDNLGVKDEFWPGGAGSLLTERTFPSTTAALAPFAEDLTFVKGMALQQHIDNTRSGDFNHHNWGMLLTGREPKNDRDQGALASGESIDRYIARQLGVSAFPGALHMRNNAQFGGEAGRNYVSWNQDGSFVVPRTDPAVIFDELFGGQDLSNAAKEELARARQQKKSMLDFWSGDLEKFRRNMGQAEREQIEIHLGSLRELEEELAFVPGQLDCSAPSIEMGLDDKSSQDFDRLMKAQIDLLVASLACGVTRVGTLSIGDAAGGRVVLHWLGDDYLGPVITDNAGGTADVTNYHDITHAVGRSGGDARTQAEEEHVSRKRGAEKWYLSQLVYLLAELKKRPDADGKTLLDNTIVLWADSLARGWHHTKTDMPWILGGGSRYFRHNQLVQLGSGREYRPTNGLLVEIANAMGVPTDSFGQYPGQMPELRK